MKTVKPIRFEGYSMSIAQLWGSGPKFTITCGECGLTFKERIPMMDYPGIQCPNCGVINKLPVVIS